MIEKIFINSPHFIKKLAFWFISVMEINKRKGKHYKLYKTKLILSASKSQSEEDTIKKKALEIVRNTSYYKNHKIITFDDIPIVDKSIINLNYKLFLDSTAKPYKV